MTDCARASCVVCGHSLLASADNPAERHVTQGRCQTTHGGGSVVETESFVAHWHILELVIHKIRFLAVQEISY